MQIPLLGSNLPKTRIWATCKYYSGMLSVRHWWPRHRPETPSLGTWLGAEEGKLLPQPVFVSFLAESAILKHHSIILCETRGVVKNNPKVCNAIKLMKSVEIGRESC